MKTMYTVSIKVMSESENTIKSQLAKELVDKIKSEGNNPNEYKFNFELDENTSNLTFKAELR
jgi:hypothetical protein